MAMSPHDLLRELIRSLDKSKKLNIFMHNSPDPDAMASALALEKIAGYYGQPCQIYYDQDSDFLANKIMMVTLSLPFKKLVSLDNIPEAIENMKYVALVDVASPSKLSYFDLVAGKIVIDIDHHGTEVEGNGSKFLYRMPSGACISHLISWIAELGIPLDANADKALILSSYVGLKVDTSGFMDDNMSKIDREAKKYIESFISEDDQRVLRDIETPKIPLSWTKKLGEVLQTVPLQGANLFYKGLGVTDESGIIPYISDDVFKRGNFETVIIYGLCYKIDGENKYEYIKLKASSRSKNTSINLDDVFADVFFKKTDEGKKIHRGCARKPSATFVYYAGADIPLNEYSELDIEGLQRLYRLWEEVINSRIEAMFKTSSTSSD